MAQIHSYYITNAKSELNFSNSDLSEDELETALREVTTSMINNDDLFIEEEEEDNLSDDESTDSHEDDANDLVMANIINLDDFKEQGEGDISLSNIQIQEPDRIEENRENLDIDFEAILDEELGSE